MRKMMSFLLALLLVLGIASSAWAEEETINPLGDMEGSVYTNQVFGFQATLPENWCFISEEDLASFMGYDHAYASPEGRVALLAEQGNVCAMFATATDDDSSSVSFMVEDLGIFQYLDEQAYYSLVEGTLVDSMRAQGFQDVQISQKTIRLAGAEHVDAELICKRAFIERRLTMIFMRADRYMGILTITTDTQEKNVSVLPFFDSLEGGTAVLSSSQGQTYENRSLGILLELDETWYVLSEAERAQQMGLTTENMSEVGLSKAIVDGLENGKSVYDLSAQKLDGSGDCINLILESIGVYGLLMDEKSYFEASKGTIEQYFRLSGYEMVSLIGEEITFCGKPHYAAFMQATLNGQSIYERQIYLRDGLYMGVLTIFSRDQSRLETITELFRSCE